MVSIHHQCNTLACADAGPICQIKPINHVFIFCVKLDWRLLGFDWISFLLCLLLLGTLSGKNDFWVRKIIFLKLESGGCWDLLGLANCLAKNDSWVGKIIFVKLESGDCDLLGLFFAASTACLADCRAKMISGSGKSFL